MASQVVFDILEHLACTICQEILEDPVNGPCGHSWCYRCVKAWFKLSVTCPICRLEITQPPSIHLGLRSVCKILTAQKLRSEGKSEEEIKRAEARTEYDVDKEAGRVFYGLFNRKFAVIDHEDEVRRCGACHWEVNGNYCGHCGAELQGVPDELEGNLDSYSEGELEAVDRNEDARRALGGARFEIDQYDSDDSFIDNSADDANGDGDWSAAEDSEDEAVNGHASWGTSDDEIAQRPVATEQAVDDPSDDLEDQLDNLVHKYIRTRKVVVVSDDEEEEADAVGSSGKITGADTDRIEEETNSVYDGSEGYELYSADNSDENFEGELPDGGDSDGNWYGFLD